MNKVVLWVVLGVVIVVGAMLVMNKQPTSDMAPLASSEAGEEKSVKELLAQGTSQKCTFSQSAEGAASEGTVYIANGKMRQDSKSTVNGAVVESHLLIADGQAHVWTSQMPTQGFKFEASMTGGAAGGGVSMESQIDFDQKIAYDCDSWSADQSTFALPAGVTFSDFSSALKAGIKVGN